ncbi:putative RNA-binding Zn ribbon-like protein [Knoellia remsis]|jgi:predicted RNA-binding Zn ribbon-like protein|uniref:Putative RNA-binding Zn ribbon-like protein n=1 Tax=Knoellia remsis TaxID=407159 RepID=A0A2T0UCG1_9MICO|nr:ABATE domain-containing protein [Knoellia remsis]PRY55631.1 putative RNA-binding Zn ribbon-like protein [Knoellia remsis]
MSDEPPPFRSGNVLATTFTGTLSERRGEPVERIPTPQRLMDWFAEQGLAVSSCSAAELRLARGLREAIHRAATQVAQGAAVRAADRRIINDRGAGGRAHARLAPDGTRHWVLPSSSVDDALAVIAADAISLLTGDRDGRLALCASPTCRAAFLDTSQSRSRRWCDMNTCGNREKKARFRARQREGRG